MGSRAVSPFCVVRTFKVQSVFARLDGSDADTGSRGTCNCWSSQLSRSCLGTDDSTVVEVNMCISNTRTAYAGPKQLYCDLLFRWSWNVVFILFHCVQPCCMTERYGGCLPRTFVGWRILIIDVRVISLGLHRMSARAITGWAKVLIILYQGVSSTVYFVVWVTCCAWWTCPCRTVPYFPFSTQKGRGYVDFDVTTGSGKMSRGWGHEDSLSSWLWSIE